MAVSFFCLRGGATAVCEVGFGYVVQILGLGTPPGKQSKDSAMKSLSKALLCRLIEFICYFGLIYDRQQKVSEQSV